MLTAQDAIMPSKTSFRKSMMQHINQSYYGNEFLKKLVVMSVTDFIYNDERSVILIVGPSGSGKTYLINQIESFPDMNRNVAFRYFDATKFTKEGFMGKDVTSMIDNIKASMFSKGKAIVFIDEIDKLLTPSYTVNGENVNAHTQADFLSLLDGQNVVEGLDTRNVLFILGGRFSNLYKKRGEKAKVHTTIGFTDVSESKNSHITHSLRDELLEMGAEPEFLGRITDIAVIEKPSRDVLSSIYDREITKHKTSFLRSEFMLFVEDDVKDEIIALAEKEKAGRRAVSNIINNAIPRSLKYDLLESGHNAVFITKDVLLNNTPPVFKNCRAELTTYNDEKLSIYLRGKTRYVEVGTELRHKTLGQVTVSDIDRKNNILHVKLSDGCERLFPFPEVFLKGYLSFRDNKR